MKDIKEYYRTAIKVADTMLQDPKNSVNEVLKTQLGYKSGIRGFFSDPWNWLFFAHPLTLGGRILYVYLQPNQFEGETMKRNIIAKQQAIIKKMEEDCKENEAQRQNLQETVDFLEETLKRIEESKKKK